MLRNQISAENSVQDDEFSDGNNTIEEFSEKDRSFSEINENSEKQRFEHNVFKSHPISPRNGIKLFSEPYIFNKLMKTQFNEIPTP